MRAKNKSQIFIKINNFESNEKNYGKISTHFSTKDTRKEDIKNILELRPQKNSQKRLWSEIKRKINFLMLESNLKYHLCTSDTLFTSMLKHYSLF